MKWPNIGFGFSRSQETTGHSQTNSPTVSPTSLDNSREEREVTNIGNYYAIVNVREDSGGLRTPSPIRRMPRRPLPVPPNSTLPRTTRELMGLSVWENQNTEDPRARTGTPFGTPPNRGIWNPFQQTFVSDHTTLSGRSRGTTQDQSQWNGSSIASMDQPEPVNLEEHGTRQDSMHTPRILTPNSGMGTGANHMSSLMNSEEESMYHTSFDGWIGTPSTWRSRDQLFPLGQPRFGSPVTFPRHYGTQEQTPPQSPQWNDDWSAWNLEDEN